MSYTVRNEQGQQVGQDWPTKREIVASARRAVQTLGGTMFVLRDGQMVSIVERDPETGRIRVGDLVAIG